MKVSRALGSVLFLLSASIAFTDVAVAEDNCKQVTESLQAQHPTPPFVLATGSCTNLTVDLGMLDASFQCFKVAAEGAWGFPGVRVVSNWILFHHWNTYLGYCVGYKGTPPPVEPARAEAMRKQLEELRGKLKQ